jgi:hypothetical protein
MVRKQSIIKQQSQEIIAQRARAKRGSLVLSSAVIKQNTSNDSDKVGVVVTKWSSRVALNKTSSIQPQVDLEARKRELLVKVPLLSTYNDP